jgi:LAO/AO transport system kinase
MPTAEALDAPLRDVAEGVRSGSERALARAISIVENERPGFEALLDELHGDVGRARRIGITGPPGAGKSTLTSGLALTYREADLRVGILAVDPTSPYSGGALLGDRIRMNELGAEPGIFIRSMASRGSLGGLAAASREAADLMDAFGFDRILVETVGVGQSELAIAGSADTTVVVLVPESGDGIQAMKAGLMEVADIFVVNKSDRPGADRMVKELGVMKKLRGGDVTLGAAGHHGAAADAAGGEDVGADEGSGDAAPAWEIAVLKAVASQRQGIDELREALDRHHDHMVATGQLERRRRQHLLEQTRAVLVRRAERRAEAMWRDRSGAYEEALAEGRTTPYAVADALAEEA